MQKMDDRREVIELVNKLQGYQTTTGCDIQIDLPQIVVVGAQVTEFTLLECLHLRYYNYCIYKLNTEFGKKFCARWFNRIIHFTPRFWYGYKMSHYRPVDYNARSWSGRCRVSGCPKWRTDPGYGHCERKNKWTHGNGWRDYKGRSYYH